MKMRSSKGKNEGYLSSLTLPPQRALYIEDHAYHMANDNQVFVFCRSAGRLDASTFALASIHPFLFSERNTDRLLQGLAGKH